MNIPHLPQSATQTHLKDSMPTPKNLHLTLYNTVYQKKDPIFIISTAYKCNNSGRTPHLAHVL